ncbi:hypothetical protein, partial [Chondromyces apiculatus]|uniref:hypothetical protein n=1 Tax=Chondromyces apiculatus TaxID=51 RepID=UPI0005C4F45F
MSQLSSIARADKLAIARSLHDTLSARQSAGPPEAALDDFIPLLAALVTELAGHVDGATAAGAERHTQRALAQMADIEVDAVYRHLFNFLHVEASRPEGAHVAAARALLRAACPDGLAHVNDRIPEENAYCRVMLDVLRNPVNTATLAAIRLPLSWLDWLEGALDASEAAQAHLAAACRGKRTHVTLGKNAEVAWVDVMRRLRRYVEARASRQDVEKRLEGEGLLAPLRDALQRLRTEEAARRTRRLTQQEAAETAASSSTASSSTA